METISHLYSAADEQKVLLEVAVYDVGTRRTRVRLFRGAKALDLIQSSANAPDLQLSSAGIRE